MPEPVKINADIFKSLNKGNKTENKEPYDDKGLINAFGYTYSLKDYNDWKENRVYDINKGIQYNSVINEINTSLPQFIAYYYLKDYGFKCEYDLRNYEENNKNIPDEKEKIHKLPYILDLYQPQIRVDIEYDGKEFHKNYANDINRDTALMYSEDEFGHSLTPVAKEIIRIREGNKLYSEEFPGIKEYTLKQRNQGFNEDYQEIIRNIYSRIRLKYTNDYNNPVSVNEIVNPIRDEKTIRKSYFEYAFKLLLDKKKQPFDYFSYNSIKNLYDNISDIPPKIREYYYTYILSNAYLCDSQNVVEVINDFYKPKDTYRTMARRLEANCNSFLKADLCDANRVTIESTILFVIMCKKYNNETLINDIITCKIDNKAARTLMLSDVDMQLFFSRHYKGVDDEFYQTNRFTLMNYRKDSNGKICPDAYALTLHKVRCAEGELEIAHKIRNLSQAYNITGMQALIKLLEISKATNDEKTYNRAIYHFFGISNNSKLDKSLIIEAYKKNRENKEDKKEKIEKRDRKDKENKKEKEEIKETNEDILTMLYRHKYNVCDYIRARGDLYPPELTSKNNDEIMNLIKGDYYAMASDERIKTRAKYDKTVDIAKTFNISSLEMLFKTAETSKKLNEILSAYNINAKSFKSALAHDYVLKHDYKKQGYEFSKILKNNPSLFPDMEEKRLKDINKEINDFVSDKDKWSSFIHPYFENTQRKEIKEKMAGKERFGESCKGVKREKSKKIRNNKNIDLI